jgi:hypothetical protein
MSKPRTRGTKAASAPQPAAIAVTPSMPESSLALVAHEPEDDDNPLGLPDKFDPADYDWYPIARRKREDGWTHSRQRKFIEILADTGSINEAAKQVQMSKQSCYRLRRSPGAEAFARAWDAAIEEASRRLVDIAFERAVQGVAEPVFDKDGACIALRRKYNDRLLMFLLRAHQPERYRYAHGDLRRAEEPAPPSVEPVSQAILRLTPATPADPAALIDPEELEARLLCAEILQGELPGWQEDKGGDCDLTPQQVAPDLDKKLKRILARDKAGLDQERKPEHLEPGSHLL